MITVRIWFEKRGEASYISLLDLQRVMQRCLRRSGLPVWYTLGYNPHIYLTFACPLSLGQESLCESCDVKTEEEAPNFDAWRRALAAVMPSGLQVTKVAPPESKATLIGFSTYTVTMPAAAASLIDTYNLLSSAPVVKKTKSGPKTLELKTYLPTVDYTVEGDTLTTVLCLPAGDPLNLNPMLLLDFLRQTDELSTWQCSILRTGLLTKEKTEFR